MRVFVSSTARDLADHRAAVIQSLRKAGDQPTCMEDYPAQNDLPVDRCLRDVEGSDLYVGIFAWRYGFVPPGHDRSITELEFRRAVEAGVPRLLFLVDEVAPWDPAFRDTGADGERMLALRRELELGRIVAYFRDPESLAKEVLAAIRRHEMDARFGEVRGAGSTAQQDAVERELALYREVLRRQAEQSRQSTREAIPIALPRLRGTFVDREVERGTLRRWLTDEDRRLVLIVAPGGYGKTELVTKLLKEVAPSTTILEDGLAGILYLRCIRGEITLGHVFEHAGRIAGRRDEFQQVYARPDLPLARKVEFLLTELGRAGTVWVILDNFEDLLGPDDTVTDPEIRELMEAAASQDTPLRLLATSRAVPAFQGSRVMRTLDLCAGLPPEEAIRYLRAEGEAYGLATADDALMQAFVRRVHGIPKALESVLGYLEEHPGVTLADLMADDDLFADFDRHDCESGLKHLVTQQIGRLRTDGRLVLSALSIFARPVPRAAIQYLLPGLGSMDLGTVLGRLERNRLVSRDHDAYDLHPIVRTMAYAAIPEGDTGGNVDGQTGGPEEAQALTRVGLHRRAADFWQELRRPRDEWKTIDDLEPQLQEIHHRIRAGEHEAALWIVNEIDFDYLGLWGHARTVLGLRLEMQGRLTDREDEGFNLGSLGIAFYMLGEARKAIEYYEAALAISREIGDRQGEGADLGNLGNCYADLGEVRKAIEYYEAAMAIAREIGDRRGEGTRLGNLGNCYADLGEVRKAIEHHEAALAIAREIGDRRWGGSLANLGIAYADLGEVRKAIEKYEAALAISREVESPKLIAEWLTEIAESLAIDGQRDRAVATCQEALAIPDQDRDGRAAVWLGILLAASGDSATGREAQERGIGRARAALARCADRYEARYVLALGLLAWGDGDGALAAYRRALEGCDAPGVVRQALRRMEVLARLAPDTPCLTDVRALMERASDDKPND